MRIVIGQIAHETNTFSNVKTDKTLFEKWEWDTGNEIIKKHRNVRDYVGGMIARSEELGLELIPVFSAFAYPSGLITRETYQEMKSELIKGIQVAGSIDAVCLALHGAGVVEGIEDLEGDLLSEVRQIVGKDIPIVCTLDLHANVTHKMVTHANVLLGVNFYPHTDSYERGVEAIDIAFQMVEGKISPVMSLVKLPLMIPTSTTNLPPAKDINEICWAFEKHPEVLDCTFFHGFPYTDILEVGVSVLTITNGNFNLAKQISEKVANQIWEKRSSFFPKVPDPYEGLKRSNQIMRKPVIINETSDNPGGGTPGDGTHLLRAMLDMKLDKACYAFIYDPEVAEIAHKAGVGQTIDIKLGGKTDSLHGEPISASAYVKCLTDGQFYQSSPMWQGLKVNLGKSARLLIDKIDVIVCSVKSQVLDEQIFLLHGINVEDYNIVALKSSQHFRAAFEPIAAEIITVDSPGLSSFQLENFSYQKIFRPMYPFDKNVLESGTIRHGVKTIREGT
ncbi:Microcystin LR degradation protein MlrC [Caldalkalibacillus thermarum TA2.A1]|uniref:M81 family metallopeptidase n=1 Tax=Caldalkalibacillus thermarum (strain TA2.A1) TaxID=986075 RepID=F5L495_CALTT|nr:M81 family metallopeptidase [Caldalkalibacillus thermarum]EGL83836.1 Microcystin LR degradation protein MlrC [Caldalkalibacillus thermarum TA2.A1]QZT32488.1 M81 family metallopeptidase [Caldalkalibacillus thermarum TA2.A1]